MALFLFVTMSYPFFLNKPHNYAGKVSISTQYLKCAHIHIKSMIERKAKIFSFKKVIVPKIKYAGLHTVFYFMHNKSSFYYKTKQNINTFIDPYRNPSGFLSILKI